MLFTEVVHRLAKEVRKKDGRLMRGRSWLWLGGRALGLTLSTLAAGIMLVRVRNKLFGIERRAAPPTSTAKVSRVAAKAPAVRSEPTAESEVDHVALAECEGVHEPGMEHVAFADIDGAMLRGMLLLPSSASSGRAPALVMAHGFSLTWRQGLLPLARACQAAGVAVLVFDHRSFGESDGEPRCCVDAWVQVRGYHRALEYLASRGEAVDANRMAVFGFSLSGGMVPRHDSNAPPRRASFYDCALLSTTGHPPRGRQRACAGGRLRVSRPDRTTAPSESGALREAQA